MYTIANGGTERWLGANDEGSSKGQFYKNDGSGNFVSGTQENETFTASSVAWKQTGAWDFYALSNKDATSYFDFAQSGGADLEDFARETGRNFTYTVPTDYNSQKDLLVGAAMNKSMSGGDVEIPFYHALARIEKIMVNFKQLKNDNKLASNSTKYFLIKSITLKNVYTTGKFTFPDGTWAAPDGNSWSNLATPGDYVIELTDFERENGNIKVFDEIVDPNNTDASENIPTGLATGTKRGTTNEPNFFAPGTGRHELPIAAGDEGLYLLPQALSSTITGTAPNYTLSGPYAEIEGFIFVDNTDWDTVDEYLNDGDYVAAAETADNTALEISSGYSNWTGKANNYGFTHGATMGKFYCPITAFPTTSPLLPNKRYVLNIDLSSTLRGKENAELVFAGAEIKNE